MNLRENQKIDISEKLLYSLYWDKQLSTFQLARIYDCNPETIRRLMIKYKIKRRKLHQRKYDISKNQLERLYYKKRLSTIEIAKKYGCSPWVISSLIKKYNLKIRDSNDYHKWKAPSNQIKPILEFSPTLSYIIGVLLGDGWVYKRKHFYFICLDSKDKLFCKSFSTALCKIGLNPCILNRKNFWRVIASSKLFYIWYKSLDLITIKRIALKHPIEFIKGFYESEGSLSVHKPRKYNYLSFNIIMVNTKKELIDFTKYLLESLNFHPTVHKRKVLPPRKPIWALNISKKREVFLFLKKIQPCIKRNLNEKKRKIFK